MQLKKVPILNMWKEYDKKKYQLLTLKKLQLPLQVDTGKIDKSHFLFTNFRWDYLHSKHKSHSVKKLLGELI
jgi:hypothetical protein